MTTKADHIVDRGADLLQDLSRRVRAQGGLAARLAPELAEDAAFLRKIKPSLVLARVRGQAPTNGDVAPETVPAPVVEPRPARARRRGGPNPFLVAGAALLVGVFAAKLVDWRGHAHPRR